MQTRAHNPFTTIHTEGALLPADLLQRVLAVDPGLEGLSAADYHLSGEKLNEAINRSWNRLQGSWATFRASRGRLVEGDAGTTLTRERWLLPLFQELGYGRLQTAKAVELDGKSYPISHKWGDTPIHLVGCGIELDRRTAGAAGASRSSPHSLMQELLNRKPELLWGLVSNGLRLRMLRDNASLTRQAFLEFDLESMFDGEIYSDFAVLWLVCHQSRVETDGARPCWLEAWSKAAQEQGTRALDSLRQGVEGAISALGSGFLRHPANQELRADLRSGALGTQEYYRQLLRLVYRLIFLFVAEDRDLLFDPASTPEARGRYLRHYSLARIRHMAERSRGGRHPDLYAALRLVTDILGGRNDSGAGKTGLGLPVLGGFLFVGEALRDLESAELDNESLLSAIRHLTFMDEGRTRRAVDYKNLGSEELGSIYESLLELHPLVNTDAATFELTAVSGSERKTTGSYYTPSSLIQVLLDSALEPVMEQAMRAQSESPQHEQALLNLKICDPACGSGHFLVAAAHRLARRLAAVRTGEGEPAPEALRSALRAVISNCIYGVDINPMSVELCKVSLWMEALEPGKPLSFLDAHIQCGDSLVGVSPDLDISEIPDEAFNPAFGDDKATAAALKKRNKRERTGQLGMRFDVTHLLTNMDDLARWLAERAAQVDAMPEDDSTQVQAKAKAFDDYHATREYLKNRFELDLWTAAFFWKIPQGDDVPKADAESMLAPTQQELIQLRNGGELDTRLVERVKELAERLKFFHWELAFPKVFSGDNLGFDCVLGNPPWERTAFEDTDFFAVREPNVLVAETTAHRKELIEKLKVTNPSLYSDFLDAKHLADAENLYYSFSGKFPLGASGRINTYALFTDLTLHLTNSTGRIGIIVQTGIATDVPMEQLWKALVDGGRIVSLYDFENRLGIFPGVHRSMKFCLLNLQSALSGSVQPIDCGFFLQKVEDIKDSEKVYKLSAQTLSIVNPNTKQPPVCRSHTDLEILKDIHERYAILQPENKEKWRAKAWRALMSAGSSQHYRGFDELKSAGGKLLPNRSIQLGSTILVPLIEAKQIHQFDPCFATYDSVNDTDRKKGEPRLTTLEDRLHKDIAIPRFWSETSIVEDMYSAKNWQKKWILGIRDVTNATNERTAIACVLPRVGLIQPLNGILVSDVNEALWIMGALNSFALDYVARQKTPGMHLNATIFSQLPVPELNLHDQTTQMALRCSLELSYVVESLREFASEFGYVGEPFQWDEEKRYLTRCRLDALFFHLYGINRGNADYIMNTFPIIKRKDEERFGYFKTRDVILKMYDELK